MSDGNPHLACGIAENGHYVAACANCGMPLIEHSIEDLNQALAEHLADCPTTLELNKRE